VEKVAPRIYSKPVIKKHPEENIFPQDENWLNLVTLLSNQFKCHKYD
jgi:hypothetical protein